MRKRELRRGRSASGLHRVGWVLLVPGAFVAACSGSSGSGADNLGGSAASAGRGGDPSQSAGTGGASGGTGGASAGRASAVAGAGNGSAGAGRGGEPGSDGGNTASAGSEQGGSSAGSPENGGGGSSGAPGSPESVEVARACAVPVTSSLMLEPIQSWKTASLHIDVTTPSCSLESGTGIGQSGDALYFALETSGKYSLWSADPWSYTLEAGVGPSDLPQDRPITAFPFLGAVHLRVVFELSGETVTVTSVTAE